MSALWKFDEPVLLASSSATRRALLASAGLPVETISPDVDEREIEARLKADQAGPDRIAQELATAKGAKVSARFLHRLVLAADQTLALGAEAFHKPKTRDDARAQLRKLSGKTHELHSAVACFRDGLQMFAHVERARLTMRVLSPEFIEAYLDAAGDAAMKSVGGYQLEALGVHLFDRVEGDHSTILGLPLAPLLAFLRRIGAVAA